MRSSSSPRRCRRRGSLHELILARLVGSAELGSAAEELQGTRAALEERGVPARVAAFTSSDWAEDAVRLASQQEVDLLLLLEPAASLPADLEHGPLPDRARRGALRRGNRDRFGVPLRGPGAGPLWRSRARVGSARAGRVAGERLRRAALSDRHRGERGRRSPGRQPPARDGRPVGAAARGGGDRAAPRRAGRRGSARRGCRRLRHRPGPLG